jgi:hypothetical protein
MHWKCDASNAAGLARRRLIFERVQEFKGSA